MSIDRLIANPQPLYGGQQFDGALVNHVAFAHMLASKVISATRYQFAAFWAFNRRLIVGKRAGVGDWTFYETTIAMTTDDFHRIAAVEIDDQGVGWIWYHMQNADLLLAKTDAALDSWTGTLATGQSMAGTTTFVSYPTPSRKANGEVVAWMFSGASSGAGENHVLLQALSSGTWAAHPGTDGTSGKLINDHASTDAYPNGPMVFDADGNGHLTGCLRDVGGNASDNHGIWYIRYQASDQTFRKSDGTQYTTPIEHADLEIIRDTSADEGLSNTNSTAVDRNGNAHCAYVYNGEIWHTYYTGSSWVHTQVSDTDGDLWVGSETGHHSRPLIRIHPTTGRAYILFRDDLDLDGMIEAEAPASDYTAWSAKLKLGGDVRLAEPQSMDRDLWATDAKLSILVPGRGVLTESNQAVAARGGGRLINGGLVQ